MREMESHGEQTHFVKRVVLPSGKTIEVVYFESVQATNEPGTAAPERDLHICVECASELVYPTEWEEAGPENWRVSLRCPNCEWDTTGVYAQETVDRFDEELDRGTEALVRDLKRLMQANMEDEIERFVRALDGNHVLPEDF